MIKMRMIPEMFLFCKIFKSHYYFNQSIKKQINKLIFKFNGSFFEWLVRLMIMFYKIVIRK